MSAAPVATAFVAAINRHDVPALASLMTEDHAVVDALDNRIEGRDAMVEAWRRYFALVPDYWLKVETLIEGGEVVALFGRAGGTYSREASPGPASTWEVPAALRVEVRGGRVALWQVFADNLPLRRLMGGE